MKQLMREPLVHFLLLGAVIFAAYSLVSKGSGGEPGKIVVTQGQLASMWESFTLARQRAPTREEWEGLIRDRVREEVYYREALALGLDKDDTIIRRRLQQKMEFVTDDVAAQAQPTDAELNAYLQAHPESVSRGATVHLPPGVSQPGEARQKPCARRRAIAGAVEPGRRQGRYLGAGRSVHAGPRSSTRSRPVKSRRLFGDEFAKTLGGLSPGQWQGPVESAYGVHLVFVSERLEARVPALADVRDVVRREWDDARRLEAKEKFLPGAAQALHGDGRNAGAGESRQSPPRGRNETRAPRSSFCSSRLRQARSRTRFVPGISNCARPGRRPTTRCGKCLARGEPAPRDSTWNCRRAAPTSPSRAVRWPTMPIPSAGR